MALGGLSQPAGSPWAAPISVPERGATHAVLGICPTAASMYTGFRARAGQGAEGHDGGEAAQEVQGVVAVYHALPMPVPARVEAVRLGAEAGQPRPQEARRHASSRSVFPWRRWIFAWHAVGRKNDQPFFGGAGKDAKSSPGSPGEGDGDAWRMRYLPSKRANRQIAKKRTKTRGNDGTHLIEGLSPV